MTDETWKPVRGYEGLYEVSDQGRVRSLARKAIRKDGIVTTVPGRVLSNSPTGTGYVLARLWRGNEEEQRHVHVLVLETFVGPRPQGMQACHNNGKRSDNRVENLRWDTPSNSNRDKRAHGTDPMLNKTHCPRGHELAGENLIPAKLKTGQRECLACGRARNYIRYHGLEKTRLKEISDLYLAGKLGKAAA